MVYLVLASGACGCAEHEVAPFPTLDRDRNGRITAAEAAEDTQLAAVFPYADANRDGELTALEYLEAATE